jgi:hypothetical protein
MNDPSVLTRVSPSPAIVPPPLPITVFILQPIHPTTIGYTPHEDFSMSSTLDYKTSRHKEPEYEVDRILRLNAGGLAISATGWAILCALFLIGGSWRAALVFAPGYIVTVGYYWRAFGRPPQNWRIAIWGASFVVQGAWLAWIIIGMLSGPLGGGLFGITLIAWWAYSSFVSLICLIMEVCWPCRST